MHWRRKQNVLNQQLKHLIETLYWWQDIVFAQFMLLQSAE
jgi:hypothetical protein